MQIKFKAILNKKWFIWGICPIFLVFLWLMLSFWHIISVGSGFTTLSFEEPKTNLSFQNNREILSGEKITGEFQARENYLGIVEIRFNTFNRINDDTLIFRIREKGASSWYYENDYSVKQFRSLPLFPFGFPVIANSVGKTYDFELESLGGKNGEAVAISADTPIVLTEYSYPKGRLLANKEELPSFLYKKFINSFSQDFILSSLIYLLPLIFYISWQVFSKKYTYRTLMAITVVVVFIDIFLIKLSYDEVTIVLILLWAAIVKLYRFESSITFLLALLYLVFCPMLLAFNLESIAEKAAVWAYMFLVVGTIQSIWELKRLPKRQVTLSDLLLNLFGRNRVIERVLKLVD